MKQQGPVTKSPVIISNGHRKKKQKQRTNDVLINKNSYVKTPLLADLMSQGPDSPLARDIAHTPVQRMAEMEEVGDAIALMASPMAGFMQGAAMVFDGGFTTQ